ncbi:hypothetical protein GOBAR_DD32007 [Gossypium barbadense]|nr:hypothetical protein GOBAR_DD32007 [Gossypium barbadense]
MCVVRVYILQLIGSVMDAVEDANFGSSESPSKCVATRIGKSETFVMYQQMIEAYAGKEALADAIDEFARNIETPNRDN